MSAEHPEAWQMLPWLGAVLTAILGWFARGLRVATSWARLESRVDEHGRDINELRGMFQTHLANDEHAQRELQHTLAGISRDLNQLIGRSQAERGEG